jgi:hypothetical protein
MHDLSIDQDGIESCTYGGLVPFAILMGVFFLLGICLLFRISKRARRCANNCVDGLVRCCKCLIQAPRCCERSKPGSSKGYWFFEVRMGRKRCGKMVNILCAKICCWKRVSAEAQMEILRNEEADLKKEAGLGFVGNQNFIKSALGLSIAKKNYQKEISCCGKIPKRRNAVHPNLGEISSLSKFLSSPHVPRPIFNRSQSHHETNTHTQKRAGIIRERTIPDKTKQYNRVVSLAPLDLHAMPKDEPIEWQGLPEKDRRKGIFESKRPTFGLINKFLRPDNSIVPIDPTPIVRSLASGDLGINVQFENIIGSKVDDRYESRFTTDYIIPEVDEENWGGLNAYEKQKSLFFKDDFGAGKKQKKEEKRRTLKDLKDSAKFFALPYERRPLRRNCENQTTLGDLDAGPKSFQRSISLERNFLVVPMDPI